MQGVFINGRRPKSKKEIVQAIATIKGQHGDPTRESVRVSLEATSAFGHEYYGSILNAPDGTYPFVGPDPYRQRNFYGSFYVAGGIIKVS